MSAVEDHLANLFQAELASRGVTHAHVTALPSEFEAWQLAVTIGARPFVLGFNWRDGLLVREAGRNLVSNDHRPIATAQEAFRVGAAIIAATLANPAFPPRDPPIL